jgi:hypothetical protein
VIDTEVWISPNGKRFLVAVTRLVDGRPVREVRGHPENDPRRQKLCAAKREWYAKQKRQRGEKWLRRQRELKRRSRQRTGHD